MPGIIAHNYSIDTTLNAAVRNLVHAFLITRATYSPGDVVRWTLPIEKAIDDITAKLDAGEIQIGALLEEFARQSSYWLADAKAAERQLAHPGLPPLPDPDARLSLARDHLMYPDGRYIRYEGDDP
jgi:hypothetical protein